MAVTFGTRSAMRDLEGELEVGERVIDLAACSYAGAAGLAALTNQRVLAIRDDYSKHQVQFATLGDIQTIDYDPNVHDGFAVFTAKARLVVRKMRRVDGDRLVDGLLVRAPHIEVHVTRPGRDSAAQRGVESGSSGRHRKPAPSRAVAAAAVDAAAAQAGAAQQAAQNAATQNAPDQNAPDQNATARPPEPAGPSEAGARSAPRPSAEPVPGSAAPRQATDQEILLGVLADLHTQGVPTSEEFAAKVRQVVAPD